MSNLGLVTTVARTVIGEDTWSDNGPGSSTAPRAEVTPTPTPTPTGTGSGTPTNKPNRGRNAANLTQGVTLVKVTKDAFSTTGSITTTTPAATTTAAKATGWFAKTGLGRLSSKLASLTGIKALGAGLGRVCAVAGAAIAAIDIYQDFQKEEKTDACVNLGLSVAGAAAAVGMTCLMATGPVGWAVLGLAACTGFGLGNFANRLGGGFIVKNAWSWLSA